MTSEGGVTIVSNRLPVVLDRDPTTGDWVVEPGSGGLVQAMSPILERRGGNWIGWPGVVAEEIDGELPLDDLSTDYELHPVILTRQEMEDYYEGFANSIVWPLFHGFPDRCTFEPKFWETYLEVNDKFATGIAEVLDRDEMLWVHDYHLMGVAERLREKAEPGRLGFFLHIPFPSLENFVKLPWRADLLRALLSYDLLGFQSRRDLRHFLDCVERLMPEAECVPTNGALGYVRVNEREISVGAFPIGTDFEGWSARASSEEVEQRCQLLSREIGPYNVLLGIDRLDYTKGLIERFRALERMLEQNPEMLEKVMLFQLVVPSRENVPEYAALKREVDRTVGRINGRFSTTSWQPIRYLFNTVDLVELTALYRMATVAVVTPLYDGMNLVAKEYVSSQVEEGGVLLLGEMAGAAAQLAEGALLVNPYDIDGTAEAIHEAVTMPAEEKQRRMKYLRKVVYETNVFRWAENFMEALRRPDSLSPPSEPEYLPTIEAQHPAD